LRARVTGPLRMDSTALTPSADLKARLAVGHDAVLQPSAPVSTVPMFAAMPAAGVGLISTTNDLLRFLSAAMGYRRSPLVGAMALMLGTRRPIQPGMEQGLGWVMIGEGNDQLVAHDGGSLGYASAVAWDPRQGVGVVVLSNQLAGVSDIARHLLRPAFPLERPTATRRTEVALDTAVLDSYAGRYEAPDEGVFIVGRERDFLTIQLPTAWGLPKLRIRPESLRAFFAAELPLRVTFQTASEGRVSAVLVHPPRGQRPILASRIDRDK
jgi:D-alanyl-D-alanine-carboxypeptidase/D-alanyl-D-alanine-endopeptidase